jgi:DNA-binding response OmpR family regulator
MIVEDDDSMMEALRDLLEDSGFTISCAPDGEHALRALREHRPNLILLDLEMPALNGWQLLAHPAVASVPVVVLTATPPAKQPSGVLVLQKPFSYADLLDGVFRCLH